MSYCVNCGVELDTSHADCPLCNTPVINPAQAPVSTTAIPPFPKEKGEVDVIRRTDLSILVTVILTSTGITCALLNFLVYRQGLWSLLIIGICVLIWVFAIPAVIYTKLSLYVSILFDGIAVGSYLAVISLMTASDDWLFSLGIPITALVTLLLEIFTFLLKRFRVSYLTTTIYVFLGIAILCVGIELLIDEFLKLPMHLTWSAVVLAVCTIVSLSLITLLSRARFRNAVRRRLHF